MDATRGSRSSTSTPPSAQRVVLGRVTGAHGVRGFVRVRISGDDPGNLLSLSSVMLARAERGPEDPSPRHHEIEEGGRGRPGEARIRLRGVSDRDAAEALRGAWVLAAPEALPKLSSGEHYWFELIGFEVATREGDLVGSVAEIWDIGPHDVLVVRDEAGRQRLIPTAGPAIHEIDDTHRRITIEALPGLLDD
ncbi:MAG: ribosome maturation factor RimM [Myxococcota bacterium]|nr:ribosome maturation factor RimM [Myxococcota bacterium]